MNMELPKYWKFTSAIVGLICLTALLCSVAIGGIYEYRRTDYPEVTSVMNRYTGTVYFCEYDRYSEGEVICTGAD